jgi:hypothetical protein
MHYRCSSLHRNKTTKIRGKPLPPTFLGTNNQWIDELKEYIENLIISPYKHIHHQQHDQISVNPSSFKHWMEWAEKTQQEK